MLISILDRCSEQSNEIEGRIKSGCALKSLEVYVMPDKVKAEIQTIFVEEETKVLKANKGENVRLVLKIPDGYSLRAG